MNANASGRGVGISKIRRLVARRRKEPHTSAGTVNRSSPLNIASNHSRTDAWCGWSPRWAARTTFTSRSSTRSTPILEVDAVVEDLKKRSIGGQVDAGSWASTAPEDRHGRRIAWCVAFVEFALKRCVHQLTKRLAAFAGATLSSCQQFIGDRNCGARDDQTIASSASSCPGRAAYSIGACVCA
jgi:hypothetical protein